MIEPTERLAPSPPVEVVAARLQKLRYRMERVGRDPAEVSVVAVTKGFGPAAVEAACAVGLHDIGENYASELLTKATAAASAMSRPALAPGVRWHYLGAVQRRRVKRLAPVVACWQAVCRLVEGEEIARRAPGAAVLVEVEVTGIPGRNGCPPDQFRNGVGRLGQLALDVRGLMVVGPPGPPEAARTAFRTAARLGSGLDLPELSMGMSDDLEVAVTEGSTMVRIGRALFGDRPAPHG
jgi:uncharacterized pyridoxal phosphate-containing UPF0001 family protein